MGYDDRQTKSNIKKFGSSVWIFHCVIPQTFYKSSSKWIRSEIVYETLRILNANYFVALNLLFEMLLPVLPISRNQNFQGGFKYQTTLFKNRALAPILWNLFYSLEEFAWKIRLTYIVLTSETHPVLSLKLVKKWVENSLPSFSRILHSPYQKIEKKEKFLV